ncbi:hypothetical protein UFOVP967_99 [uncultured Caudovirales phage]|uniref:Uncharacterized protein n=1 Tax=uncultured Caudovirales phage TaxID=2100421 RepID=A0A6J5SXJ6_9CAUD|nr:hypothetical protein UFOVP521_17 [uncultured Caudovirales phage]CAB4168022.1 hypothetical protein UFOVP856_90 [uncultured Caudovirales phage]CAB4174941.1 hypothetical protein UFOVP967_99 [uncultured Caudovirales phage]CAB4180695.1 hypothetical protein UFOVP1036_83 [uncultured Caudovirales phage]CAB4186324.1 hypothetical protein UFOVP1132_85 [uncultured Caudovirales phage]
MKLHDEPTLTELVGSAIFFVALLLIGWLAIDGNAAAQTALVGLLGAASGSFYRGATSGNGSGTKPPVPPVI